MSPPKTLNESPSEKEGKSLSVLATLAGIAVPQ